MEINYDLSEAFSDDIARLTQQTVRRLSPKKFWGVEQAINGLGNLSKEAQGLRNVLTTYQKVVDSNDDPTLYIMWKKNPINEKHSIVIGLLKVGRKKLYLMDDSMQRYETTPLCVLDFYVHNTLQRQGNGHKLFEEMLKGENFEAKDIAIDKPSPSFLNFLNKFYNLNNPIWQSTNYVVFSQFFDGMEATHSYSVDREQKRRGISEKSMYEAQSPLDVSSKYSKHRALECQAAKIIHGGGGEVKQYVESDPNTPRARKNLRDFGHTHIW
uniref:Alpha-tubulin N-acetyltransferase n=1 Tax=Rhabditophanes sp. KR3021 TaxID=114890 RepID=A0AC35TR18_9BILA